jgi:signal peptidase I
MLELLDSGLIAFVLVFMLIRPFVVQAFYIPSESMEPTLLKHDRSRVNKFIYRLNDPQRGDIIVFEAPPQALFGSDRKDFVKRLIGLPGDNIRIRRGDGVYLNEKRLEEPSQIPRPEYDFPTNSLGMPAEHPYVVPTGCYFVLGDNRNTSNDSHKWRDPLTGESDPSLAADKLVGKAMVIFWPPPRLRLAGDNKEVELRQNATIAQGGPASGYSP